MTPYRKDHKVLIVAPDVLLAALIGALVESAQFRAAFVEPAERAEDALTRVKPLVLVLIDATARELSDIFLAQARRREVPVFIFGSAKGLNGSADSVSTRGIAAFELPRDVESLARAMDAITVDRRAGERRATDAERTGDGAVMFEDGAGTRWSVYDRRSADRRRASVERRFVRDDGTVYVCTLSEEEASSATHAELEVQLARARAEAP